MVEIAGMKLDRSIAASIGKNPLDSAIKAKELGADLLEIRIDLIDADAHRALRELRKVSLPLIITNRMKEEGGSWNGSESERIAKLTSLLPFADAVDIELCAQERDVVVRKAKESGKTVIISTHDFHRTPEPEVMLGVIRESFEAGADIAKLAVTPRSLEDVLSLLDVTFRSKKPVCTIAMGDIGRHSRVVLPIYGSVITYGYVDTPIAPGQLRIDELKYMLKML